MHLGRRLGVGRPQFGNLALLSPGENSSYSNLSPEKKRDEFNSKRTYDSLKLAHIFHLMDTGGWTEDKIASHRREMLGLLSEHYKS